MKCFNCNRDFVHGRRRVTWDGKYRYFCTRWSCTQTRKLKLALHNLKNPRVQVRILFYVGSFAAGAVGGFFGAEMIAFYYGCFF